MKTDLASQLEKIKRGTVEVIREDELKSKLAKSLKAKKPLKVKAGFDPTAPDIHLGHTVLLRKLRHFQMCGHKVTFLVGDATAIVGDPSGQNKTRKTLTWNEIGKNVQTYVDQVSKILDTDPKVFEVRHNSDWFSRHGHSEMNLPPFTFEQFVELAQRYTVARLIERDDFQKRLKENRPITFLELFYPLMQGYDSVKLQSDVELGGTDQKFNLLVGRNLQREYGQESQVVITMPLLEGLDGTQKMSKSLNNYIGISEAPEEMFGKVMSISDDLMLRYYLLLTDEDVRAIEKDIKSEKLHPMQAKRDLAKIIIAEYHGISAAKKAEEYFNTMFIKKTTPDNVREVVLASEGQTLVEFLTDAGLCKSRGDAKRVIASSGVKVNNEVVCDINYLVKPPREGHIDIRKGKRDIIRVVAK